jgi:hypothetical protein
MEHNKVHNGFCRLYRLPRLSLADFTVELVVRYQPRQIQIVKTPESFVRP